MNVVYHEDDGQRLKHSKIIYVEAFPDYLEEHNHENVKIEKRKLLQLAVLVQSFTELFFIDQHIIIVRQMIQ